MCALQYWRPHDGTPIDVLSCQTQIRLWRM